jgi:hypothetical protein
MCTRLNRRVGHLGETLRDPPLEEDGVVEPAEDAASVIEAGPQIALGPVLPVDGDGRRQPLP